MTDRCRNGLSRVGVRKVHWECWSNCNLACPFCFRTSGTPLTTGRAVDLLTALSTGGVRSLAFAGGDPSLRPDMLTLTRIGESLGLQMEVHTNAQHTSEDFLNALKLCWKVGLSLDADSQELHDSFRRRPGNYRRVLHLLELLDRRSVPVSVRTVVTRQNYRHVPGLGRILARFENLLSWTLLEFSPIGTGFRNRGDYLLSAQDFADTARTAANELGDRSKFGTLRNQEKVGSYMIVSPAGNVYGVTDLAMYETGQHTFIGSVIDDHLADLAEELPLISDRHLRRYGDETRQIPQAG